MPEEDKGRFCLPLADLQKSFYKHKVSLAFSGRLHPPSFPAAEVTVFLWQKLQVVTKMLEK